MCRVDIVLVSPLQSTRRESKILRATKRCTKSTVNLEEGEVLSKIFIVINQEDIEVINGALVSLMMISHSCFFLSLYFGDFLMRNMIHKIIKVSHKTLLFWYVEISTIENRSRR